MSHAASAFYPSPYYESVIVTIDGVGEWSTTTIGYGKGNEIKIKEHIKYPHSIGLFYSAFTYFCGFKVNSGDYKFMGLAPYGKPVFIDMIQKNIIHIYDDGSFSLNMDFFDYQNGRTMINEEKFSLLFGGPRRMPESVITKREMDIAASVQKIVESVILKIVKHAKEKYGSETDNLVMAGGVALNCVANGKIQKENIFKNIWIQPAAGDAGGALGAALAAYYDYYGNDRVVEKNDSMNGAYLGPQYKKNEIYKYLVTNNIPFHEELDKDELHCIIAQLLTEEKVIGLFDGRMEFGPRALGNRSIIADCRFPKMQSRINLKVKYRESFRPFAPIVLKERSRDYFDLECESPYMLKVGFVNKNRCYPFNIDERLKDSSDDMIKVISVPRSDIPAVTHVDYSARIQTVDEDRNPNIYSILKKYEELTGYGVLVNTSFNVRGEPIVCTPKDAYECFMRTDIDVLVLGQFILYKEEQSRAAEVGKMEHIYD